jgi:hypothetical protein
LFTDKTTDGTLKVMDDKIGVIGAAGDLGVQLTQRLREHFEFVFINDPKLKSSTSIEDIFKFSNIIHICAPLDKIKIPAITGDQIVVLHDSVMSYSKLFSSDFLEDAGAIVHMLMNKKGTVVVASDASHAVKIHEHMKKIGYEPHFMTVDEHDYLMAHSQAPLALLCQTLLPYLYEKQDEGLLTASGQLLADTLKSREIIWTPETMTSILRNPQLKHLIADMQSILTKVGYNKDNE